MKNRFGENVDEHGYLVDRLEVAERDVNTNLELLTNALGDADAAGSLEHLAELAEQAQVTLGIFAIRARALAAFDERMRENA